MDISNVTFGYPERRIFEGFSLHMDEGERLMLSAPSGRGKTTLLMLIMGLLKPDSGGISGVPEKMSAVFQEDRLPECFTPVSCVKMTAPEHVSGEDILRHLAEAGLSDEASKPVNTLSGGQRRRVAIVRAVICDADLILLDEPFTGLDTETKKLVCDYINRYTAGKMLIAVSHGEDDAELLKCKSLRI